MRAAVGAVVLVALLAAGPAPAADEEHEVSLAFSRDSAAPGDSVEVTADLPLGAGDPGMTVYLLDVDVVEQLVPEGGGGAREPEVGPGVTLLGVLGRAGDVGKLTFVVPDLPPGRYTTAVWCLPCGGTLTAGYDPRSGTSAGSRLVLEIGQAAPAPEPSSSFGRVILVLTLVVLALAAVVAGGLLYQRRRREGVAEPS